MLIHLQCKYEVDYPPARGAVLLLSCMDLRLIDNIVQFMDHDNLTNRYDHLTFAGASLGALGVPGYKFKEKGKTKDYSHWKEAFLEHMAVAYELRKFKDVYIVEHRHCGAYAKFLGGREFSDSTKDLKDEAKLHLKYARKLEKVIDKWAKKEKLDVNVRRFIMDLRGNVKTL